MARVKTDVAKIRLFQEKTGMKKTVQSEQIRDINRTFKTDLQQKIYRWRNYISHLFDDEERKYQMNIQMTKGSI